jgi:hypothetical protein
MQVSTDQQGLLSESFTSLDWVRAWTNEGIPPKVAAATGAISFRSNITLRDPLELPVEWKGFKASWEDLKTRWESLETIISKANTLLLFDTSVVLASRTEPKLHPDASSIYLDTSVVLASRTDLKLIQDVYALKDRDQVLAFLDTYPFLIQVLVDIYFQAPRYFSQSQLTMKVVSDPEEEDSQESHMVVRIVTHLPPEEAVSKLRAFQNGWWIGSLDRAQDKLSIGLEFG